MQLLDALDRLEAAERRFQNRRRMPDVAELGNLIWRLLTSRMGFRERLREVNMLSIATEAAALAERL